MPARVDFEASGGSTGVPLAMRTLVVTHWEAIGLRFSRD
jgi:hypothetical protein